VHVLNDGVAECAWVAGMVFDEVLRCDEAHCGMGAPLHRLYLVNPSLWHDRAGNLPIQPRDRLGVLLLVHSY
jgi:hypothetical protein